MTAFDTNFERYQIIQINVPYLNETVKVLNSKGGSFDQVGWQQLSESSYYLPSPIART